MPKLVSIVARCAEASTLPDNEGETFSIGRSVSNTLCLLDPSVSRNDCVLSRKGLDIIATDLSSVNRTYINGLPLTEHAFGSSGDEIKIGESLFYSSPKEILGHGKAMERGQRNGSGWRVRRSVRWRTASLLSATLGRYFDALLAMAEAVRSAPNPEDAAPADPGVVM